jgi:hypothetical protein
VAGYERRQPIRRVEQLKGLIVSRFAADALHGEPHQRADLRVGRYDQDSHTRASRTTPRGGGSCPSMKSSRVSIVIGDTRAGSPPMWTPFLGSREP